MNLLLILDVLSLKGGISLDERAVIQRCQEGELDMFEYMYDKYREDLYRFCLYLARDADAASDLFQDTWLKAIKNIGRFDSQRDFLKWLFAIAANSQKDRWRWKSRWAALLQRLDGQPSLNQLEQKRNSELLCICLDSLDDNHRIPVILHYIQGFSQEEISALLKIPPGTVKSRLHYARKKMKQEMEVAMNG